VKFVTRIVLTLCLLSCGKERVDLIRALDGGVVETVPPSATNVRVAWQFPQRLAATSRHYGLGIQSATDPARFGVPGAALYKQNLAFISPGLVNILSVKLMEDSTLEPTGWLKEPDSESFVWDRDKIQRSLEDSGSLGAELMLTIPTWPRALGPSNVALAPENYERFARLCADLVRVLNVELNRGVRLFQILNEVDTLYENGGGAELGKLVAIVAQAMKAVDPTIGVGGAGFVYGESPLIPAFLSIAGEAIDFVTFHGYGTGDVNDSLSTVFARADRLGQSAETLRVLAGVRPRPLGIFQTQWALNWQQDPRMAGQAGAVFDTLAMLSFVKYGLSGATGWKDADGWYGKLDEQDRLRPTAHAMALLNRIAVGEVVATHSPAVDVTVFAVRGVDRRTLLLVNRTEAFKDIQVEIWNGALFSEAVLRTTVAGVDAIVDGATTVTGRRLFTLRLPALSVTALEDRN